MFKLFCKHKYKLIEKRESTYTTDWVAFTDCGWWIEEIYECERCGKWKTKLVRKEN